MRFAVTPSRLVAPAAAIVLIGGALGLFLGAGALARQRSQIQALRQRIEQLEKHLATQTREQHAMARELVIAEGQLTKLTGQAEVELSDGERARNAEIAAWLGRVKRLKQVFDERPDQWIPEMRLLTDDDWLRATKEIELDDEESVRKALGRVRTAAKEHFASSLATALPKFVKAHGPEAPAIALALAPYLENPADAEFLSHVEVIHVTRSEDSARHGVQGWAIQEKRAVDPDYDSRYSVNRNGSRGTSAAPQAWIPGFDDRRSRAYREFSAANNGLVPAGLAQLLPYFNPPLDRVTAEKLIKAERAGWR